MTKLQPGDPAPEFALADADGKVWRLEDLRGKRVVLYFYPADDTPGCTAESCDFRDNYKLFSDANVEVLGVSPQGAESHRRFATKYELNFPLLIDQDLATASAYGATAEKVGNYKGIPLKIKRSTFVIDPDGKIEEAIYGVKVRGHVDALKDSLGV
ncbi:MAG TPA: peroxiredoxin [Vicinamibacterales bacterium]|nr:peroxiredoxin [Vicinamibacterales bacterium]